MVTEAHARAVRAALLAAAWMIRPAGPERTLLRVWDARFEGDQLVVEFTDHSCCTLTLDGPPGLTWGA